MKEQDKELEQALEQVVDGVDQQEAEATEEPAAEETENPVTDKPEPQYVVRSKTREYLKYTFTEEELREKAREMARSVAEAERAEDEGKSFKKQIDSRVAQAQAQIRICSENIRSGYEFRNIECDKVIDYRKGICTVVRLDTGEIVHERPLRPDEAQMVLV